jgi:hypothetical protein
MLVKVVVQSRRGPMPDVMMDQRLVRPVPTAIVGVIGGFLVGMTSVGSGSLMIVMLMLLYPTLSSREMVGTDLVQAIPLVASAAFGHILFGDFELALTGSLLLGDSGVYIGARIGKQRPVLRPSSSWAGHLVGEVARRMNACHARSRPWSLHHVDGHRGPQLTTRSATVDPSRSRADVSSAPHRARPRRACQRPLLPRGRRRR